MHVQAVWPHDYHVERSILTGKSGIPYVNKVRVDLRFITYHHPCHRSSEITHPTRLAIMTREFPFQVSTKRHIQSHFAHSSLVESPGSLENRGLCERCLGTGIIREEVRC
jgi:hypothetical protein